MRHTNRNIPSFRDLENHGFEIPKILRDVDPDIEGIVLDDDDYTYQEKYY